MLTVYSTTAAGPADCFSTSSVDAYDYDFRDKSGVDSYATGRRLAHGLRRLRFPVPSAALVILHEWREFLASLTRALARCSLGDQLDSVVGAGELLFEAGDGCSRRLAAGAEWPDILAASGRERECLTMITRRLSRRLAGSAAVLFEVYGALGRACPAGVRRLLNDVAPSTETPLPRAVLAPPCQALGAEFLRR